MCDGGDGAALHEGGGQGRGAVSEGVGGQWAHGVQGASEGGFRGGIFEAEQGGGEQEHPRVGAGRGCGGGVLAGQVPPHGGDGVHTPQALHLQRVRGLCEARHKVGIQLLRVTGAALLQRQQRSVLGVIHVVTDFPCCGGLLIACRRGGVIITLPPSRTAVPLQVLPHAAV